MDTLSQLRAGKLAGATRLDLACGLEEFPREIFDLADTLEILNLTGNQLSTLPADFARLSKLRILFCSQNRFEHLPESIGACPALSMVGFKSNQIRSVSDKALPKALRWLILTDNQIEHLPSSLGQCHQLQKLMLSGNRLSQLPATMAACERLEMVRLAANNFEELPAWLLKLPRLSWLALAGNPCALAPALASLPSAIPWSELELIELIGEGASGFIHRARWLPAKNSAISSDYPPEVAVKIFKGAMTSDGLPDCEVAASLTAGAHPHMIGCLGHVVGHPSGAPGLVMELIASDFTPLAGPPSFDSCTRDIYAENFNLTPQATLRTACALAAAAAHLHRHGIMHGDFYAHNVLTNPRGDSLLGDFGAASFYPPQAAQALQAIEARAFGYLLEELDQHTHWDDSSQPLRQCLNELENLCLSPETSSRPSFDYLSDKLQAARSG